MSRTPYERHIEHLRIAVGESYVTSAEYQVVAAYIDGIAPGLIPQMLCRSRKTIGAQISTAKVRLNAKTIYELIAKVARADALRGRGSPSNRDDSIGARLNGASQ